MKFIFQSDDKGYSKYLGPQRGRESGPLCLMRADDYLLHHTPFLAVKVTRASSFFFFFKEIHHFSYQKLVLIITVNGRAQWTVRWMFPPPSAMLDTMQQGDLEEITA